jgi:21S rRNA (GM2251-2'-O)-methyltransferase
LWQADVVFGVSPVLAALEAGRRTVHTLYVQEGVDESKRKDKGAVTTAMEKAKEMGAVVKTASKHDLNMVSDNRPHQGLILDATALDFEQLDAMPAAKDVWDNEEVDKDQETKKQPPVWLCLDEVVDPQNFGAALRSAFFLGATGVLTCKRNSAPLSPVVSKASSGALELMPVHSCRNLPQTLADAKLKGWTVLGAAAQSDAISCATYKLQGPTILVMGNEGYGLRTTVRQQCDAMLRIDGAGGESGGSVVAMGLGIGVGEERVKKLNGLVDSLNVSVATGILMHQLLAPK